MKKKVELETLEISVVVNTLLLVVYLISGVTKAKLIKLSVHVHNKNYMGLPGLDGTSSFESQRPLGFGCQVPFRRHSAMCNCSLSSGFTELPS